MELTEMYRCIRALVQYDQHTRHPRQNQNVAFPSQRQDGIILNSSINQLI